MILSKSEAANELRGWPSLFPAAAGKRLSHSQDHHVMMPSSSRQAPPPALPLFTLSLDRTQSMLRLSPYWKALWAVCRCQVRERARGRFRTAIESPRIASVRGALHSWVLCGNNILSIDLPFTSSRSLLTDMFTRGSEIKLTGRGD